MPKDEKDHVVEFLKEKETKNTVRFQEAEVEGQPPVIGTLYIQKWFVGEAEVLTIAISKK